MREETDTHREGRMEGGEREGGGGERERGTNPIIVVIVVQQSGDVFSYFGVVDLGVGCSIRSLLLLTATRGVSGPGVQ